MRRGGLSYKELSERVSELPEVGGNLLRPPTSSVSISWTRREGDAPKRALQLAVPARPVELLTETNADVKGWETVEELRSKGVPYEVLLLQREVSAHGLPIGTEFPDVYRS